MKIVQINATCGVGSTGKICVGISQLLEERGLESYILYSSKSNGYEGGVRCSSDKYLKIQSLKSRILGNYGFNSKVATRKIISRLERINPDVVHLHNIHGHDCDLETLFKYFKERGTRIFWTFHDCWAFTAYCPHFVMAKCDKWRTECNCCVQSKEFSWFFDRSSELFRRKKALFSEVDLTIITPSKWLAGLVKQSFLADYPVMVVNNGIDLGVFKPSYSDFRRKCELEDKKLIIGVAFGWGVRKGLDVFVKLSKRLPDDYKIVLIGTDDNIDKQLPDNIISIHRTQNQTELAKIYTSADIFVNPTREENYPTVNMESLACGTPVLTFRTGGSPEIIDETCGSVVDCDDVDALEREIIRICSDKPYSKEACLNKAKTFDQNERFKEYIQLYERVNPSGTQGD